MLSTGKEWALICSYIPILLVVNTIRIVLFLLLEPTTYYLLLKSISELCKRYAFFFGVVAVEHIEFSHSQNDDQIELLIMNLLG